MLKSHRIGMIRSKEGNSTVPPSPTHECTEWESHPVARVLDITNTHVYVHYTRVYVHYV